MINNIFNYFSNLSRLKFIIYSILICISFVFFYAPIVSLLSEAKQSVTQFNPIRSLLYSLLIAPLIETFIFQFLFIEFLQHLKIKNQLIIIFSSLLFGTAHYTNNYTLVEVLITSVYGIFYAFFYLSGKKNKAVNAFVATTIIHSGYNLFVYLIKIYGYFYMN